MKELSKKAIQVGEQRVLPTGFGENLTGGISKRELFAGLALMGLSSTESMNVYDCAKYARIIADNLLEELVKE